MDTSETIIHDLAIIGAGPSGLAVAARLREARPSALFTDVEHERFQWIEKHREQVRRVKTNGRAGKMTLLKEEVKGAASKEVNSTAADVDSYDIQVFDSTAGEWMGKWKKSFRSLEIKTLRSPLFFHPDPRDRDGLKEFAYTSGRESEMLQLKGVVGKEISKHKLKKDRKKGRNSNVPRGLSIDERDMQDYQTPSTSLFHHFCEQCSCRYGLNGLVKKAEVQSIHFQDNSDQSTSNFRIETTTGVHFARAVVLAVGPGTPLTPPFSPLCHPGSLHSSQIAASSFLSARVRQRIDDGGQTTAVVIGGGLTSAQISDLCIRKGFNKVYHLMRNFLRVQHFDLSLPWVTKFRNLQMSAYHLADSDEERAEMIRTARGGGSITPVYRKVLAKHEAAGKLQICQRTFIVNKTWDEKTMRWSIETEPAVEGLQNVDFIYFATGAEANFAAIPFLKPMLEEYPIKIVGGFPCLTDDLQWRDDIPLWVTGRYASLRVGPGAANLEGARVGAERVMWNLKKKLADYRSLDAIDGEGLRKRFEDELTYTNMYEALDDEPRQTLDSRFATISSSMSD